MKITVDDFSTGYDGVEVLHHIGFSIDLPGIYVVLGKNGAGKTTLFRAMTGMLKPFTGSIMFDDVPQAQSKVGDCVSKPQVFDSCGIDSKGCYEVLWQG